MTTKSCLLRVSKAIPYTKSYKNYKLFKDDDSIDTSIELSEELHKQKYENDMIESNFVDISSSEDSGYEGDGESVRIRNKKPSLKRTICHAITYDRKFLKMKFCLEFIKNAGFDSLTHNGKIYLNWTQLYNYIYKENKNISDIFECKQFKFVTKEFDPEDTYKKIELMKFVNRKLEDMLGVKISKPYKESEEYKIQVLFEGVLTIVN